MPTRDTPWPNGTPCWVDYGASDLDATRNFYADLLGWEYTGGEPEFGGYLTATRNGQKAAGLAPRRAPDNPPRWTTYFATDDAAATATRIREAGGTVLMEPADVGPVGTMVLALDPQGNLFALWQAGMHAGFGIYDEPGGVTWNEAAVDDADAARVFYGAVFGFRFDEVAGSGGYTTFATDDRPLGGLGGHQPGSPKGWTTCFSVPSVDEAVAAVESAGGKVTMAATDTSFGRFAVVEDPWGAPFSVMESPGS
jgi:predicted enzyme related to lactoylglutathione lyase